MNPPELDSLEDYNRRFADLDYWRPYVEEVCRRHGLGDDGVPLEVGVPGTYPVFIVDRRWVVKFFGRLFNGGAVYRVELEANGIAAGRLGVRVPTVIASGSLYGDTARWSWPYLAFEFLPDNSLGQVRGEVSRTNMVSIAEELGHIVSRLHSLPVPGGDALRPTWDAYTSLLENGKAGCEQRHRAWADLPARLLPQIDAFIPSVVELIPRGNLPVLLHGDLTDDHILVRKVGSVWKTSGLIDFGDAMVGDPLFELIAFLGDRDLFRAFMRAYRPPLDLNTVTSQRLLCLCLLHPYNVFRGFFQKHPEAAEASSLGDLASWLWGTESGP